MRLSRRDALRVGGGLLATGGVAGCVERRVTSRETRVQDSSSWALSSGVDASLGESAFQEYVDEMADAYGDSGVWGLDAEPADSFEGAYVQRLGIPEDEPGESSLDPDSLDLESPLLVADAAVAVYEVEDGVYRYWLWAAADGTDDRLVRNVDVSVLSARVVFRNGSLSGAADVERDGDEATVSLGGAPEGSFPLNETTGSVESTSQQEQEDDPSYGVDWSGGVEGAQSVNGVCEEERDGAHDFFWRIAAGYNYTEQV